MRDILKYLCMFTVIIWFTSQELGHRPKTWIEVWPSYDGVSVESEPIGGNLIVTPRKWVIGFPNSHWEIGSAYMNTPMWTIVSDDTTAIIYINRIKETYKDSSPVVSVKRMPDADKLK